jgi:hypothetical protein
MSTFESNNVGSKPFFDAEINGSIGGSPYSAQRDV